VITTTTSHKRVSQALKKIVVLDLDASGSMAGARTTEALEGVGAIRKVLRDEDHVAVYAFNKTTTCVTPRRPNYTVDTEKLEAGVRGLVGGCTQLWQSIRTIMATLRQDAAAGKIARGVHVNVVVLSDGGDGGHTPGSFKRLVE